MSQKNSEMIKKINENLASEVSVLNDMIKNYNQRLSENRDQIKKLQDDLKNKECLKVLLENEIYKTNEKLKATKDKIAEIRSSLMKLLESTRKLDELKSSPKGETDETKALTSQIGESTKVLKGIIKSYSEKEDSEPPVKKQKTDTGKRMKRKSRSKKKVPRKKSKKRRSLRR